MHSGWTLSTALLLLQVTCAASAQPLPGLPGAPLVPVPPPPGAPFVPPPPGVVPVPPRPGVVPAPPPRVVVPAQRDVWSGTYNTAMVREMQVAFNHFGFNAGVVDGIIGGQTRRAVRAYQRSLGAVATGTLRTAEGDLLISDYRAALTPALPPPVVVQPTPQAPASDQLVIQPPGPSSSEPALAWHLPSTTAETAWLDRFYGNEYRIMTGRALDWSTPPFVIAAADLDGQPGNPAILVRWRDAAYCASGVCEVDIWYFANGDYGKVGDFVGRDVTLGSGFNRGFRDLMLDGTRLRWNGSAYTVEGIASQQGGGTGPTVPPTANSDGLQIAPPPGSN